MPKAYVCMCVVFIQKRMYSQIVLCECVCVCVCVCERERALVKGIRDITLAKVSITRYKIINV